MVLKKTAAQFVRMLRQDAAVLSIDCANEIGSHALHLGIARDILDVGGSLAAFLRAGAWSSEAFAEYLREHQIEECSISRLVIDHADSE